MRFFETLAQTFANKPIDWEELESDQPGFDFSDENAPRPSETAAEFRVPRRFVQLARSVACHRDPRLRGRCRPRTVGDRPSRQQVGELFEPHLVSDRMLPPDDAAGEPRSPFLAASDAQGRPVRLRPDLQAALRILVTDRLWARASTNS